MARISLEPPSTLLNRLVMPMARRRYGKIPDPGKAMAHNGRVLIAHLLFEMGVAWWKRVDPTLKALAVTASAARIGCSWCMDFGYWEHTHQGIDGAKLRAVSQWRDSELFSPLERRVMEYAEAMSADPMETTDEMVEALRIDLGEAGLVELTAMVAVENQRSRFNRALGLTSQGFREFCDVPRARQGEQA
ncbi:carboxymuconolactone decarboxylase family protein [Nocardiopsis gilva YIM 90087]|uniref:Carboxymuconolactone decarboxylase family protein n=1 Tax=Nocardiopsis gilva YIM 90087 TaxID=1235441 RepID=A0A223S3I7_9ACTN|nr:carboxymuconolactone decarboxylase family protein [Nocardiopsis gilva]ASU82690.1 carboxymuconolactone decarboxylase family protein [Nocardiopsis gilva YIM 90087]